MIQFLSGKYRKHTTWLLLVIFELQLICPLYALPVNYSNSSIYHSSAYSSSKLSAGKNNLLPLSGGVQAEGYLIPKPVVKIETATFSPVKVNIGGPGSPEAASFRAVGSNNLVNLATGDFSYSIPLLDVGGYPVNLFYSGGVSMEQEASWVGLGWNINPGSVNRNMRGVPDDFNGTDLMTQTQHVKPNRTWGGELGVDLEFLGIKQPKIGVSVGFSYNNYLGPALDLGASVSLSIPVSQNVNSEKSPASSLSLSLSGKLSSRSGLTLSPSIGARTALESSHIQGGIGLSTSYNSRSGLSALNLSSEVSYYSASKKAVFEKQGDESMLMTENRHGEKKIGGSLGSSSISFAKPSYVPSLRMPLQNSNYSGQIEFGLGVFGIRGSITALGYYSESKVPTELRIVKKPMVGYLYSEKANTNQDAVMDFNRLNDAEVTPKTPVISAPQYNYDVFSIQGEGTGGNIRAYRGDLGFVRDNVTVSKEKNLSIGIDLAIPFHYGTYVNTISSPTRVGGWEDGHNTLRQSMKFSERKNNSKFENVYFRNPGEMTVTNPETLERVGGDNLVRFALGGSNVLPRLESSLEQFDKLTGNKKGNNLPVANKSLQAREKRTQVTTMLTASEAAKVGLEKHIRNYRTGSNEFNVQNSIVYDSIPRVDTGTNTLRKAHHISEIDVLEVSGVRYVYGLPVYSIKQKDFTFSVEKTGDSTNIVNYDPDEPTTSSHNMNNSSRIDGYLQIQETPAYASSFLLTGLLSADYVDVQSDGITEDDLGGAVKFNYTKSAGIHKWRTPRRNTTAATGHFSEGIKSEKKDNKANLTYGEREVWYLNSIESKSMIAIFTTSQRNDAKGVLGEMDGRIDTAENANKKLSRIDLYTKSEIRTKGFANAKPVKSVHFDYGYSLCTGTPDNKTGQGKLTLKSVYFSYNGLTRQSKDRYVFNYGDTTSQADNPNYSLNASDRWGTYKPKRDPISSLNNNPSGMRNADYPYTGTDKTKNDRYAGAWSLKKILLPSGGQMEIQYEADDYAYVQNRRACNMFQIYGLGSTASYSNNSSIYNSGNSSQDNYYVYIHLPQPLQSTGSVNQKAEIFSKYLEGISQPGGKQQLAVKLMVKMPKGPESLTIYPEYDEYGVCTNSTNKDYIYIRLKPVGGKSPLANSVIGFLTENIPGQAFEGYEIEPDGIESFFEMIGDLLPALKNGFKNVDQQMRSAPKGKYIFTDSSFIRLANPHKMKYGGGYRIKKVLVKDNWNTMSSQYNSVYGQDYDYTTTEKIYNKDTVISSGVGSYEPGIGSEENPFREIISFSNKLPLASAQYGAIEMPLLEGLYPSPVVVYSKVTVRSIHRKGTHGDSALRSAIGKQVTEHYTARDFPSYSTFTGMSSKDYNKNPFFSFFYKEIVNRRTISQGFLVETNDMHGKIKSQVAYGERDSKTPLSASYYTYKNTGKRGLNDKVDFVYNAEGGAVKPGNMGIDVELMTDVREFNVKTNGFNGQLQVDIFTFGPIWVPIPTFYPMKTYIENKYRAVTCTKLINYHAIEDSVVIIDKGSIITTKTIAYDSETGLPVVTKTSNEFNDPVFTASYPAYWAYSGTGPAYKNIDRQFAGVNFYDGQIQDTSINVSEAFESGDELFVTKQGSDSLGCIASSDDVYKLWAIDRNVLAGVTVWSGGGGGPAFGSGSIVKDIVFTDSIGRPFTKSGVSFRIIRSGKRNNLGQTVFSATSMGTPVYRKKFTVNDTLRVNDATKVVAASASQIKERWQTDNEVFLRKVYYKDTCSVIILDSLGCNGILQKNINPYLTGLLGNFKPFRSYTYYGSRDGVDTISTTAIRKNGYIKNFSSFWNFDTTTSILVPDSANAKWVWNSELTKVNSKGQELETMDALKRYTSAQYGFDKNLPVAMAQNARNGESFYEGFEDFGYNETINKSQANTCAENYIDFKGLTNSSIIQASTEGIKAHTGKQVLKVNTNSSVTKSLSTSNSIPDKYSMAFPAGQTISPLTTPTGNSYLQSGSVPANPNAADITIGFSNLGMSFTIEDNPPNAFLEYNAGLNKSRFFRRYITTQNITIPTSGTYTFTLNAVQNYDVVRDTTPSFSRAAITFEVRTLEGETILAKSLYSDIAATTNQSGFLECGSYIIVCDVSSEIEYTKNKTSMHLFYSNVNYTSNVSGATGFYVSCNYNKPIPASDSMRNPVYTLKRGKKMQFSAWVKEDCTTPCYKTDFTKSKIEIRSNGVLLDTMRRTGKIIEGWQKIEGVFTLPADSTMAELVFVNTNTSAPMYVDDMRLHPYNANMKSYAYDQRTLRLLAELDENNYASFYEYDEEGQLVRVKKETIQGIKTIKESRSAKQKSITDLQ